MEIPIFSKHEKGSPACQGIDGGDHRFTAKIVPEISWFHEIFWWFWLVLCEGNIFFNTLFGSLNHFGQNVLHLVPNVLKMPEL